MSAGVDREQVCVESFRVSCRNTAWNVATEYALDGFLLPTCTCTVIQLPGRVVSGCIPYTPRPCSTVPVLGFPVMINGGRNKHAAQSADDSLGPVFRGLTTTILFTLVFRALPR